MRFISHLDLMRAFERALRRSGLPLRTTEGFNPHPRLSFPSPLGVGSEGSDEVMEFELSQGVPPAQIARALRESLPSGLELRSAAMVPPGKAAQVCETVYIVRPYDPGDASARIEADRLRRLLDAREILVERRRKEGTRRVNIRPFVVDLRREGDAVVMRFSVGPSGTTRPEEVLAALGFSAQQCHALFGMERTQVLLRAPDRRQAGPARRRKES